MEQYHMISRGDKILIALSGGADSVYLTLVLLDLKEELDLTLGAIHVNHRIRGQEADRDEAWVRDLCQSLALDLCCVSYDVPMLSAQRKQSEEETGREVRREAFYACAREKGYGKIALAHHASDLAETMLHHMARGSSLAGLASLRPVRGELIRPLLCLEGELIRKELKRKGISWREDATNLEDRYTRNGIRHHVLPYLKDQVNTGTVDHMFHLSMDLAEIEDYLEQQGEALCERVAEQQGEDYVVSEALLKEPKLLQTRVLRRVLERAAGQKKDLGRIHLNLLIDLLEGEVSRSVELPYGLSAIRDYQGIRLGKNRNGRKREGTIDSRSRKGADGEETMLQLPAAGIPLTLDGSWQLSKGVILRTSYSAKKVEKKYTKTFPYDKMKNGVVLRTRRSGDYLVLNEKGEKKLLKRYFIDRKIPREQRDRQLLICAGSEVLWIIGERCGWQDKQSGFESYVQISIEGGSYHEGKN